MTLQQKEILIELGRKDLVDAFELRASGYLGINYKGKLVDRRIEKDAIPVPKNTLLNIPEPKKVNVTKET